MGEGVKASVVWRSEQVAAEVDDVLQTLLEYLAGFLAGGRSADVAIHHVAMPDSDVIEEDRQIAADHLRFRRAIHFKSHVDDPS